MDSIQEKMIKAVLKRYPEAFPFKKDWESSFDRYATAGNQIVVWFNHKLSDGSISTGMLMQESVEEKDGMDKC